MKNTFGQSVSVTVFGESHGEYIGAVIDGLAPGIKIDEEFISGRLARRRPSGEISTKRQEKDEFRIVSGVFEGYSTGTPICIIIPNADTRSTDYKSTASLARPSHADYAAYCKYHGFEDYRGGGHFSGRITAAIVAAGAICELALAMRGITVGTHILRIGKAEDRHFSDIKEDIKLIKERAFPVLCDKAGDEMKKEILSAKEQADSIGGATETAVFGLPAGIGEPFFDSLESTISHAVFSVPAIKGVAFGAGFGFCDMLGSAANDPYTIDNGNVTTKTNNCGGIYGGISIGTPIIFSCAVKPTPSIGKEQDTIDFIKNENAKLKITGRHDPAIIHRACPVIDAVTAIAVCDAMAVRFGTDFPHIKVTADIKKEGER